ncbi:M48 family metallopeptidase [Arsukibacterium sp.]|uniref:M48 family metallopeptidase n=1 Tax=Arsukibacterium sp. TaxID=1977258 RepID=UPI002FD9042F
MNKTSVTGQFQYPGRSSLHPATASIDFSGNLQIICNDSQTMLWRGTPDQYQFSQVIPGLAVELELNDGALFTPANTAYRWPQLTRRQSLAAWLESHKLIIISAIIGAPLALWWLIAIGIPATATAMVPLVPDAVRQQMGQHTFYTLKKTTLQASELPAEQQQELQQLWQQSLAQLPLRYQDYQLHFFRSRLLGANAFALPDGTVVITDDLVKRLADQPDALLAIMLHEIGHVEQQHSMRLVAQSLGAALVFGILFGDVETLGELVLGSGAGLLQNAFSRDMEREADQFALTHLQLLGKSPNAFADAMTALLQQQENSDVDHSALLKYLSTHPDTAERIEQARKAATDTP